ncbi:MAG: HAD family hydrolase [Deltaproteobacteria bacterium]|nr:HAD family hydrolase [Deltaproteobacteria bacterium]
MNRLILDALIFDLDGTLIDTMGVYFQTLDVVCERLDLPPVSRKEISDAVKEGNFNWDLIFPLEMLDKKDGLIKKARVVIEEVDLQIPWHELEIFPGVREILKEIAESDIKIGIVTATPVQKIEKKLYPLKRAGIAKLLDVIITEDDALRGKPAADPLIECGKRLDVEVDKSAYVGDSRVDIKAGKAAGMKTIGVLTGLDDYDSLKKEDPDLIIDSVVQLREVIDFIS